MQPEGGDRVREQSLKIAERLADDALPAPPVNLMGRIYWTSRTSPVGAMLERSVEQMRRLGNRGEESTAAATAGCVLGLMGEFERAPAYADEGVRLAEELRNPFAEGGLPASRHHLRRAGRLGGALDRPPGGAGIASAPATCSGCTSSSPRGEGAGMTGDPAAGSASRGGAGPGRQKSHPADPGWPPRRPSWPSAASPSANQPPPSRLCREAIRVAREGGEQMGFLDWRTGRWLRHSHAARGGRRPPRPTRPWPRPCAWLDAIHARPELARTYLHYGAYLRHAGDGEGARRHLAKGLAMFEAMGMTWDGARARELLAP